MVIIIDASVFVAYANKDDIHNKRAQEITRLIIAGRYGRALTTDYIFDETISVVLRKSNKINAVELGNYILNSEIHVAKIDSSIFEESWNLFKKFENFSFTDCTTLAIMKTLGIKDIATFDKEFRKLEWINVVG